MKPSREDHTHNDTRVADARGREIQRSWLRSKWNDFADRLVDFERRQRGMSTPLRKTICQERWHFTTTSSGRGITIPDTCHFPVGTVIRLEY